jgi:hypothetical protein
MICTYVIDVFLKAGHGHKKKEVDLSGNCCADRHIMQYFLLFAGLHNIY